jgi:phosphoribosylaminoimidazole-succinocarboxamide synthase
MNLYQITQEFLELASMIEDAGGEVNDAILEELAISRENFSHKAEGYARLILKWDSEIEAAAAEVKRIQALKKAKENSVARLKETLLFALQVFGQEDAKSGIKRYDTALFKLSTRRSQAVEITDETSLPDDCFVIKREVSKTAIKKLLEEGWTLDGAGMKENVSLQIK